MTCARSASRIGRPRARCTSPRRCPPRRRRRRRSARRSTSATRCACSRLAHHASTTAHQAADTSHTITAPAASSAATLRTLARQLQELGNAHDRDTAAHGAADEAHDSEAADPVEAATKTRAIAQWVPEVSVEIWAWDDTHPSDDAAQMDAWLVLQDWTWNAVRSYGRGVHKLDRTEPATEVVHVRRGFALVAFLTLPIPVHEAPGGRAGRGPRRHCNVIDSTPGHDARG